eukprot:gene26817-33458_t
MPDTDAPDRPLLVLIAGPYLSGADGDPTKIAANRARLEAAALPIYERGHLPLLGEWLALPIVHAAGGREPGDAVFHAYQYPVAERLLARCDAVLRLPGASQGADMDVARAQMRGLPVGCRMSRPSPAPINAQAEHVRLLDVQLLSNDWYVLRKVTFELQRRDGQWQRLSREAYDRGNGATLLLFNPRRGTVVLTRQFRLPAFLNGCADGHLLEACAGLLDGDDPETCIRREAEEETGYRIRAPLKRNCTSLWPTTKLRTAFKRVAAWLHMRLMSGLRGKVAAWWALVGLLVTTFAFLGVNMFLSGLHSYGKL